MVADVDDTERLVTAVQRAFSDRSPLAVAGSGTRSHYGYPVSGEPLDTTGHQGVISYRPEELVIQVRAGTRMSDLAAHLAEAGQVLSFDPPLLGGDPTVGEIVASGLAGPARPWSGSVRDSVLGVTLLTGQGTALTFGGQVMKNVAGYDVARLTCGAWGTLGVILDVSFRVQQLPAATRVYTTACDFERFRETTRVYARALPLTGAMWGDGRAFFRVAGSATDINRADEMMNGRPFAEDVFAEARDQLLFDAGSLWRISVPPMSDAFADDMVLAEWGGAQRWLVNPSGDPRVEIDNGHATLVRAEGSDAPRFHPLPAPLLAIHKRLKAAFDPAGILNPGKMYAEF